jgi:hypothetical protein
MAMWAVQTAQQECAGRSGAGSSSALRGGSTEASRECAEKRAACEGTKMVQVHSDGDAREVCGPPAGDVCVSRVPWCLRSDAAHLQQRCARQSEYRHV